ncbi:MAG TPA: aminopeptidase P family protein [Gemmatimonadales bacterium]|jgi:Xaa-Pro aminopeptidase|nr:aminopeptidase P family protein [Gemmatimonadales bacterium]
MGADRRRERHETLVALLETEGLDALLVTSRPNIRYLTGFSGSAGLVVVTRADLLLVTDFRYDEQARAEAAAVARVEVEGASVWDRLFKELPSLGALETVGYEAHALTVKDAERLSGAGKPWRWKAAGELVERLRACKDLDEVAAIRAAAALAGEALQATLAVVRPGLTELEIAGLLERALRRGGSEAHPFPTIVASGPRSALPHAHSSGRAVAAGEWLLLDFGAVVDGYCADITRTVVVGARATEAQRALYELVQSAQRRARDGVRVGMPGKAADALARELIEARGFGDAFGHSTGHGLGLEVHEAPRLARTALDPLPLDAVVTVEPGVYVPGRGGVRIEDDVHVSAAGPVLLSDGRTDLVELV